MEFQKLSSAGSKEEDGSAGFKNAAAEGDTLLRNLCLIHISPFYQQSQYSTNWRMSSTDQWNEALKNFYW